MILFIININNMKDNKDLIQNEKEQSGLEQYDTFLGSLNQKLQIDEKQYETYLQKIKDYDNLYNYIQMNKKISISDNITKLNIGNGVFVEAKIPKSNNIIFNIGLDIYVELDYEQAEKIILKRKEMNVKRAELLRNEIIKNKSYYKLTKDLSNQLKLEKTNETSEIMQNKEKKSNDNSINI